MQLMETNSDSDSIIDLTADNKLVAEVFDLSIWNLSIYVLLPVILLVPPVCLPLLLPCLCLAACFKVHGVTMTSHPAGQPIPAGLVVEEQGYNICS